MGQKIKINENLTNIFNYIESLKEPCTYMDLIQYCIDYDLYQEFYLNNHIINYLYEEKMRWFENEKKKNLSSSYRFTSDLNI